MKPTWKDILDVKRWVGSMDRMRELAFEVGYPYFMWNDRIYDTASGEFTGYYVADIT